MVVETGVCKAKYFFPMALCSTDFVIRKGTDVDLFKTYIINMSITYKRCKNNTNNNNNNNNNNNINNNNNNNSNK